MPTYLKRIDNKQAFTQTVYRLFTDACGGKAEDFADILYGKYVVEDFYYSDDFNYEVIAQYFRDTVIPHKIAVYQAGLELSRSKTWNAGHESKEQFLENLWLHDMSKFSAAEAAGYAFYDFKGENSENNKTLFKRAWHHHKTHNQHHPEYWLGVDRRGNVSPLPMSPIYVYEMVADWIGAGKTYGSTLEEWLPKNLSGFLFHRETAVTLKGILEGIGFDLTLLDDALYVEGYTTTKTTTP